MARHSSLRILTNMIFALSLAVLCATAFAAPHSDKCVVGEWGEWSACKSSMCPLEGYESYHMDASAKKQGKGRSAMKNMMHMKTLAAKKKQDCLAQGTCPEFLAIESEGASVCEGGFANDFWPCSNVDLLAFIDWTDLGFDDIYVQGNDMWGWTDDVTGDQYAIMGATHGTSFIRVTDPLAPQVLGVLRTHPAVQGNDMWVWHDTANNEDYAIMGATHGSSFIRITDPLAPEVLGVLRTHTSPSTWRDMKVVNDHAYIVSEAPQHGMQVFDMTRLRDMTAQFPVPELKEDVHYDKFGNCHNIASFPDQDKVYAIGCTASSTGYNVCDGGLHIIDVSDPKNPTFDDCIGFDGYVHDAECFQYDGPDTDWVGSEICFGYNEDSLTIYDVARGEAGLISRMEYTGSRYTHQGWVHGGKWLLLDDELDEVYSSDKHTKTYVWNIEDLDNPVLTHTFYSAETAIDHNMYIIGNTVYQTNYEAGLRVLNIDEETGVLTEVAYFDVFPSRTTAEFYGSWSNYPWLNDNVIGVSSIDYGFFLLKLNVEGAEATLQNETSGEMHRYRETVYGRDYASCPALVDRKVCVKEQC